MGLLHMSGSTTGNTHQPCSYHQPICLAGSNEVQFYLTGRPVGVELKQSYAKRRIGAKA
mgnify:CR=1 FL=1